MGKYDVTVIITQFEPDALIEWTISGHDPAADQAPVRLSARAQRDRHPGDVLLRLEPDRRAVPRRGDLPGHPRIGAAGDPRDPGPDRGTVGPGLTLGARLTWGSAQSQLILIFNVGIRDYDLPMARRTWEQTERRGRGLAEEANAAVRSGQPLDPTWLASAAGWLAQVAPVWPDLTDEVPAGRQYRLIASSLRMEAWLICWPSAGRLELHDHGGASGALRVVGGVLSEQFVADRSLPARRRRLQVGQGISFDADYVHDVVNSEAEAATSVHVYSSAARPMAYYRLSDGGTLLVPGVDEVGTVSPDSRLSLASIR